MCTSGREMFGEGSWKAVQSAKSPPATRRSAEKKKQKRGGTAYYFRAHTCKEGGNGAYFSNQRSPAASGGRLEGESLDEM